MSDLPIIHYPPIFSDDFIYRGANSLPGAYTIPDHWTVSGEFSTSSGTHLECTQIGTLAYSGTPLSDLKRYPRECACAFKIWFRGQENLIFSLLTNWITPGVTGPKYRKVQVDCENNEIRIYRVINVPLLVTTISHPFQTGNYYLLEVWYRIRESPANTRYIILINGQILTDQALQYLPFRSNDFCLEVSQLPTNGTAIFNAFRVYELTEPIDPEPITDASDLIFVHREDLQESIENPPAHTWNTFKSAYKHWKWHKDFGRSDENWTHSGYAVRRPTTEEWFT